jgi:hypothetical protein
MHGAGGLRAVVGVVVRLPRGKNGAMNTIRAVAPGLAAAALLLAGCATAPPPRGQDNLCRIFAEQPRWYDHAQASEKRWGTPIGIQMAFVQQESSFQAKARPERQRILGIIPGKRPSSAYGYAQAQDPAWSDYQQATGRRFARRSDMGDALDFIGWYNDVSHRRLGLAKTDARNLYLAYHEGHGGYRRGTWRNKRDLQAIAARVEQRAATYQSQLASCESSYRCRRWYQVWPLCS